MPKETEPNVDDLISNTLDIRHGGIKCWAHSAEGKLKEYLDRLRDMHANEKAFSFSKALEQAREVFGVKIKHTAFRNHVSCRCGCQRDADE